MKKLLTLFCLLGFLNNTFSQETYNIKNESLTLKTEVAGSLDLLWTSQGGIFRYFIKNEKNEIVELKNTKNKSTKKYNQEYLQVLAEQTKSSASSDTTKFTLASLKTFIELYNASVDPNFQVTKKAKIIPRASIYGGLTNNPFVENPENSLVPLFAGEVEVLAAAKSRHAGFAYFNLSLKSKKFKYQASQIGLGYRFRFINQEKFSVYTNLVFATYTTTKATISYPDPNNSTQIISKTERGSAFDAPLIFGLGSDLKISSKSYITLSLNELFALALKNQGNFPINFTMGYKINL